MLSAATGADERVSAAHRAKLPYVYVRQSSVNQVRQRQESTALQVSLVDRAVGLGWPRERVLVIDEDLGKSGAASTSPALPSPTSATAVRRSTNCRSPSPRLRIPEQVARHSGMKSPG